MTRSTVCEWRNEDAKFAMEWDAALERGTDHIEDGARHRAIKGVKDPVFYEGRVGGAKLVYSDMFAARAA